jgi:arabinose-5-phosphate isomerase
LNASQLKALFQEQKKSLNYFLDHMDLQQTEQLLDKLARVKGTIFFSGVGKSGFIAQKIVASLISMGIKSYYLPAVDALHGDLGIIDSDDLFVILSKSGESEELLNLIPFIRNRGVEIISIVSNKQSRLAKASHMIIELPLQKELCPHNVIPTTSTEIQLIFGDIVAIALMHKKQISLEKFARNHPAGKIGKRLSIKVEDIMITGNKLPLASPKDKLTEVIPELSEKRCGCVLIIDTNQKLLGIFTDGDLRRAIEKFGPKLFDLRLDDLQTKSPKTIELSKFAWEAMQIMEYDQSKPIMVLPVLDQSQKICGLIKMHDLLQAGIS